MNVFSLHDVAIVVNPEKDNVAVASRHLRPGWRLTNVQGMVWDIKEEIKPGHRFALTNIPAGHALVQYGQAFALSIGVHKGEAITTQHISGLPEVDNLGELQPAPSILPPWEGAQPLFKGFRRPDGRVGVRNWLLVVPMSMCAAHEAARIVWRAEVDGLLNRERFSNVSGMTHLTHVHGCGCPDIGGSNRQPGVLETLLRMLGRTIDHPNVGGAILVALGCEKTHFEMAESFWGEMFEVPGASLSEIFRKPIHRITLQESGGSAGAVAAGLAAVPELVGVLNRCERQVFPASELVLGLECGGSDAFSGITANPALGAASDLLIRAGGCSLIGEVPEFHGAESLFLRRSLNSAAASEIRGIFDDYGQWAAAQGASLDENPSPGNQAGGLLNIAIKSLGAVAKSGWAPVAGGLRYGESVQARAQKGLFLLNTPGYDQISVPGLVAAGAQLVCFTTGRGTPIGNAIAPVIKIASQDQLTKRMPEDIDFNAGAILRGESLNAVGLKLFELILAVASGQTTASERNGHREFVIWDREGIAL